MRVLKQLAIDEKDNFSIAADVALQVAYLDDILIGYSGLKELEKLNSDPVQLFESVGLSLQVWCFSHSNCNLPVLQIDKLFKEDSVKTLEWHGTFPAEVANENSTSVRSLPVLEKLKIQRWALSEHSREILHHGFFYASKEGFGAVTYISV
ncbi:hypothetical protein NPIL_167861 [Nephila pilipes]|uniref:Uncharacterized protein n=1 Tax=Nephila pilipes TaxID=299642 RepID=A0A8X6PKC5_NEPPI|nr:hypothetical protein NPIL_167861 [Nephila pilipes]